MNHFIEKFNKYSALILIYFYSLGFVFIQSFYSNFDIEIVNYITLTDVLILSISIFIVISMTYLFFEIILLHIFQKITEFFLNIIIYRKYNHRNCTSNVYHRYRKVYKSSLILGIVNILISLTLIIVFIWITIITKDFIIAFTYVMPYAWLRFLSMDIQSTNTITEHSKPYIIIFAINLLSSFFFLGIFQSKKILSNQNPKHIEFECLDIKYKSNEELIYIGETSNYLFMFNKKEEKTLIFFKENIQKFKVKKGKRLSPIETINLF